MEQCGTSSSLASKVQSNSVNASPDISSRDVFPLFELSRELRNTIYGFAYGDTIDLPDTWQLPNLQAKVERPPLPSLLRTSKQVKAEYEQSINELTTSLFIDNEESAWDEGEQLPPLFSALLHVKGVKVVTCAQFYGAVGGSAVPIDSDIRFATNLVNVITRRMPQIINISLHLCVYRPSNHITPWPASLRMDSDTREALDELSTSNKVIRVELSNYPSGSEEQQENIPDNVWASWTPKDGWKTLQGQILTHFPELCQLTCKTARAPLCASCKTERLAASRLQAQTLQAFRPAYAYYPTISDL